VTLRGSAGEFPLEVVLRLLADQKKTGELSVRGKGGEGALGIAQGRVVTAEHHWESICFSNGLYDCGCCATIVLEFARLAPDVAAISY